MDLIIEKINGGYCLKHHDPHTGTPCKWRYIGYSKHNAIKQHRKRFGLRYKHINIIDI